MLLLRLMKDHLKRVQKYASKFKMPFLVVSKERDYTQMNTVEKAVLIGDKKHWKNSRNN